MRKSDTGPSKWLLAGVALGAFISAEGAYAQDVAAPVVPADGQDSAVPSQPPPSDAEADGTEIVVTGFRSSLAKALEIKRQSAGVVDSIVAEDIAKFPDNNLAESIQRIPGVAIARDQGEGRSLSVRGLGPDFTRVQINGMEAQASTDGIAGGANRGRGFDFNVFASELFSRIDVNKTASARLPEGSLGATVDLYTGHPFDFAGFRLAASGQESYNDQSDRAGYRGAFLVSDRFADDRLGALFSVAYSHQPIDVQGSNSGGWNQGSGDGGFCRPTSGTGGLCDVPAGELPAALERFNLANAATTYNPRFYRYAHSKGTTDRLGVTGSVQWKPSDATTVTLDGLYSRFETNRQDFFLQPIGFSRVASQGGKPETLVRDLAVDANGTMTYGLFDNVDMRAEHAVDDFTTMFRQATLSLDQKLGEQFSFLGVLGYSESK